MFWGILEFSVDTSAVIGFSTLTLYDLGMGPMLRAMFKRQKILFTRHNIIFNSTNIFFKDIFIIDLILSFEGSKQVFQYLNSHKKDNSLFLSDENI